MLISFTVGNYRSFNKPVTLSMEAESRITGMEDTNLIKTKNDLTLLNAAAIYGANASGKSNLVSAMGFMKGMIIHSSKDTQKGEPIAVEPFLLNKNADRKPSYFEISLLLDNIVYTYGFKATTKIIVEEWLYYCPETRTTPLFHRKGKKFDKLNRAKFKEGFGKEELTRENALFLSTVAQLNGPISGSFLNAIKSITILPGYAPDTFRHITSDFLDEGKYSQNIRRFMCELDLAIKNIDQTAVDLMKSDTFKGAPKEIIEIAKILQADNVKGFNVTTYHGSDDEKLIPLNLYRNESHGTQKLFALAGPIIDTISRGNVLFIDEFESRLHPLLSIELIKLFRSDKSNKRNAQIIFTTHDSNLLNRRFKLFRRDQIWFAEKRKDESSDLYSLMEFAPRNDAAIDLNYLRGKYGAIPFLSGLSTLMSKE